MDVKILSERDGKDERAKSIEATMWRISGNTKTVFARREERTRRSAVYE